MKVSTDDKLVSHLVDQIHARILSGEYAPGDKLRQETLASEFQVSRTPIREALTQLAARGVIVRKPRLGAVVKTRSTREIREIYRVRAELEGLAAELAAQWITDQQLAQLRRAHERFVRAVSSLHEHDASQNADGAADDGGTHSAMAEWIDSNAQFHAIIFGASGNSCLKQVIADLNMGYTRNMLASSALGMYRYRMEQTIAHHADILAALERRDPQEARRAMSAHILESGEFVAAWLESHART